MSYTDKEWAEWCHTFDTKSTAAPQPTQTQTQPTVINNFFFVDNSVNIQAVVNPGSVPVQMVDERQRVSGGLTKYLPPMYQPGNMEATAQRLLKEKAGY